MRISIAMATYNGESFISEQLESLARQSYLPCELVVTDDGSTDRTLEILKNFSETSPFPVRVYCNDRTLGPSDNFFKAAKLATGEWIAFCDQDDVWLDQKLEHVVKILNEAEQPLLIVHSAKVVDENLHLLGYKIQPFKDAILMPLQGNPWFKPSGFSMIFKAFLVRDFGNELRPPSFDMPSSAMFHDRWVYFIASILGNVIHCSEALALYRRHSNSVTNTAKLNSNTEGGLTAVLKTGADYYFAYAKMIREYARFLDNLALNVPSQYHKSLAVGAKYYGKIATSFEKRADIYRDINLLSKLSTILFLVRTDSYRHINLHGHAMRPFLKDILYLVASSLPNRKIGTQPRL